MDSRPSVNAPVSSTPPAAAPAAKPKLLEVNLLRKYAPHFLVQEDGSVVANEAEVLQTVEPGIMKLHHEDAAIALGAGVALPTRATFKDS